MSAKSNVWSAAALALIGLASVAAAEEPRPISGKLVTRWASQVDPKAVLPEYPRPQMARKAWLNLNGHWDYALPERTDDPHPLQYLGKILVPFPIESTLSGVARFVGPDKELVYRRKFKVPDDWGDQRVLLHFGAVDWEARVEIDHRTVGEHRGGYDPFSFDITDALGQGADRSKEHELIVTVYDPTDAGPQPRGKQVAKPHGIWYTPVTGIWQTVWLEPVPRSYLADVRIDPNLDHSTVTIRPTVVGDGELTIAVAAKGGEWRGSGAAREPLELPTPGCQPWSPEKPTLYDLVIELRDGDRVVDRVESYFAQRKIELGRDANGTTRILLNGQPYFQFGPLDQGWWPDGLYTAPTDEALLYDLKMTKECGFNLVRKHVKVEPARWYYHCDRLGLLVWQDMPSGDANARWPLDGTELARTPEAAEQYGAELSRLIDSRRNSPAIVAWVPFNEAWGQFQTERWTKFVKERDPSRLVISASGGNDFGVGDVRDIHFYPQPEAPPAETRRAVVLGEYGGLGLPVAGHTWADEKNWGYRQFKSREEMQETYLKYIADLRPMVESRLSAAIYTQTTDVEIEVNGIMTYDRAVTKFDPRTIAAAHRTLYAPLRKLAPGEQAMSYALAYWRFEDTTPGEPVPHDRQKQEGVATRDVSGHRNHLYAFAAGNAPRGSTDVPGRLLPLLGLTNSRSLDDTAETPNATRDLYTDPGRSRTHMDAINSYPLVEWTVEVSFRPAVGGQEQTLVGEDGKPTDRPEAPLQLYLREDDRLAIVVIDRAGEVRTVASLGPVRLGEWHHAAAMSDGKTLRLYLRRPGGNFELEGETDIAGGLVLHDGTWTVGRGFHAGAIGRDARARIDEVRVSTRALPLDWLLWSK